MDTFCPNPKSIYKNFTKKLQKNCKKIAKKLQKNCKKVAKILQKNLQNFCRFFAEFLQLHNLQKVLHFRPREESIRSASQAVRSPHQIDALRLPRGLWGLIKDRSSYLPTNGNSTLTDVYNE